MEKTEVWYYFNRFSLRGEMDEGVQTEKEGGGDGATYVYMYVCMYGWMV